MCLFELEDYYDKINCIVFPRDYAENAHIFMEGKIVYIDVMASWCKPCLAELKEYEKTDDFSKRMIL